MNIDLDDIGKRLFHGMPISMDETRQLYTMATGKEFPKRVRCKSCQGEGLVPKRAGVAEFYKRNLHSGGMTCGYRTCRTCEGTGYNAVEES